MQTISPKSIEFLKNEIEVGDIITYSNEFAIYHKCIVFDLLKNEENKPNGLWLFVFQFQSYDKKRTNIYRRFYVDGPGLGYYKVFKTG